MVPIGCFPFPCPFLVQTYKYNDRTNLLTKALWILLGLAFVEVLVVHVILLVTLIARDATPLTPTVVAAPTVSIAQNANMADAPVFLAKHVHVLVHALPLVDYIPNTSKVCHLTCHVL